MPIRRATKDRWIMGVCGGSGHSLGIRPNMVRLVFILLAIFLPEAAKGIG